MIFVLIVLVVLGGLGYAIFAGVSGGSGLAREQSMDAAEVTKSIASAVGLFLAMLAVTAGLIDLLQAIVEGSRLSGSNSDLARGLSLLIVGTPVFVLLLRLVDKKQGGLGWSVHLVAALSTLLVGVLVSAGMIIDDLADPVRSIQRVEVAQLVGWFAMWLGYWFGLRPRFTLFGHVHLAVGTLFGLSWLITGVIAVGSTVLSRAYDRAFGEALIESGTITDWLLVAAVGLIVWLWHWIGNPGLNRGDARTGRSWYASVVAFTIVPATITMLAVATASIAGTLVWFFGTTDTSAAEWFEPAPAAFAVLVVALVAWTYHRWEVVREGERVRCEASRFHDYALAAVGLVGAVVALAGVLAVVLAVIIGTNDFAGGVELDNQLIGAATLLIVAACLWWWIWQRIMTHRAADPVAESASVWRKLYLAASAGIGGLTLAGTTIYVLFTVLRDLFDGELGRGTLDDIGMPISWMLAVAAAVWFHANVWRADRAVLASHLAASQPAPPLVQLRWATEADLGELFTLQRAAFVDEAVAYGTPDVPSLNETYDEFRARTSTVPTMVATAGTRIVGAASVRITDGLPWLERLMVAPDRRGDRIGHQLVAALGSYAQDQGHLALRAIVGDRNPKLLEFYESQGFATIGRTPAEPTIPELLVKERTLVPPS